MGVHYAPTIRRAVLLTVVSLLASLIVVSANAPAARAVAGVFINPTEVLVEEVGPFTTDTYKVVLESEPTGDVTITFSVDPTDGIDVTVEAQATGNGFLTFTPADWSKSQTVVVTAIDDGIDEPTVEPETIYNTASGGGYEGIVVEVAVLVYELDGEGVTVNEGDGVSVVEGGATDTYTVVLDTVPTDNVTISLNPQGGEATAVATVDLVSTSLLFTPANWDTPQSVTVAAVDDAVVDGATTETIDHLASSADPAYNNIPILSVLVDVTDDDGAAPGVMVTPTTLNLTEAAGTTHSGTYDVVLTEMPSGIVTIHLLPPMDNEFMVSPIELEFTTGNWADAQTVTVTAIDDTVADGDSSGNINHTATVEGHDPVTIASVTVNVTDDDSRDILFSEQPTVSEPNTQATYTVSLTEAPSGGDVTVQLSKTSDEFSISTSTLVFNAGNWSGGIGVTVTAIDDDVDDGEQTGTINHDASGGGYNGIGAVVTVTVTDDDTKGITVSETTAAVTEGGATDSYTVVLDSEPTGNVMIAAATDTGEATVDQSSLVFTPANWDSPQTVIVSAANDNVVDGETTDTITHTASGADYHNLVGSSITVAVTDDDVAGVTITESGDSTLVAEGGTTDTYRVVLDAEPGANVTITPMPDAQVTVSPVSVTFTPETWKEPKEFTVAGVEDGVDEPDPHTSIIQHSVTSTDPHFDGLAVDSLEVGVIDGDALVVSIVGPGFGAPGVTSKFNAELVTGSGGSFTFDWVARRNSAVVATGDSVKFEFAPGGGGAHTISLTVTRDGNSADAMAGFTVLGDVAGSVFVADILWLAEEGITLGCNPPVNDEFCPDDFVTRAQMAAFLVRFLGLTDDGGGNMFIDDNGSVFEDAIAKLAAAGITLGCNPPVNDEYCPHDSITRGQMAAFMVRALGLTDDGGGNKFIDDDGSVFEDAIAKLAAADITRGCNPPANDEFCPNDPVTRGQMAAFIRRADMVLNP